MILKLCRIRIHTKYEYYEGDAVDTSAFPECEGLDAAQCLRWINEHPERVGGGGFAEWRDGLPPLPLTRVQATASRA